MDAGMNAVILDAGASRFRAGFAGEKGPRLDIPTLVGHPRHRGVAMAAGMKELEVGEEAVAKRGMLTVNGPIHEGKVQNWDDMEKLWGHVLFNELRVTPERHCFICTQTVNAPAQQKEKTLELMMETFRCGSLFLGTSQVLSLYCYGLTTGVVVDGGRDGTLAVPVHEGYALGRHVTRTAVGGEVLTDYLSAHLYSEGYSLGTDIERHLLNQAKEDLCYVRPSVYHHIVNEDYRWTYYDFLNSPTAKQNFNGQAANVNATYQELFGGADPVTSMDDAADAAYEEEQARALHGLMCSAEEFTLPDGQAVPLCNHRYETPEVLFNFSLLKGIKLSNPNIDPDRVLDSTYKVRTEMGELFTPSFKKGISWLPFSTIHKSEVSLRPQLYNNIVLAGNGLNFPGARERLLNEIIQLYRENHSSEAVTPISVRAMDCRGYSAFLGGSMLARTPMFAHLVVTRKEYEEEGLRVVHCKCF